MRCCYRSQRCIDWPRCRVKGLPLFSIVIVCCHALLFVDGSDHALLDIVIAFAIELLSLNIAIMAELSDFYFAIRVVQILMISGFHSA